MLRAIREEVAAHEKATPAALRMIEEGIRLFPDSPRVWILRGDLIQLSDDLGTYSLDDVVSSYLIALRHAPENVEAFESLGRFLDAVRDDPEAAEPYLRRAVELGGGESAQQALSQVLLQLKRPEEYSD